MKDWYEDISDLISKDDAEAWFASIRDDGIDVDGWFSRATSFGFVAADVRRFSEELERASASSLGDSLSKIGLRCGAKALGTYTVHAKQEFAYSGPLWDWRHQLDQAYWLWLQSKR